MKAMQRNLNQFSTCPSMSYSVRQNVQPWERSGESKRRWGGRANGELSVPPDWNTEHDVKAVIGQALGPQALGMGAGLVQAIVSAVVDIVPPLIPPPFWISKRTGDLGPATILRHTFCYFRYAASMFADGHRL